MRDEASTRLGIENVQPKNGGNAAHCRKFAPLDTRLLLYEKALRLRKNSYTLKEIVDEIERQHNIKLTKGTISNWTRGITSPHRAGHIFFPRPSPELAYVIGVETGDAFLNVKSKTYQYRIRLRAVDCEFVEAFNQAVSRVLGCPPHRLWKGVTAKETEVEFGSYLLHKFLLQDVQQLREFVEHDKECVAAFLRGFFDSEGCIDTNGRLSASNSNVALLKYIQCLLQGRFGIETTGPRLGTKRGSTITRRGKSYKRNVDVYEIRVRARSLRRFHEKVGLTIQRKKLRLEKALAGLRHFETY
jgi:intein-encoded DNA endonuclease-like protein